MTNQLQLINIIIIPHIHASELKMNCRLCIEKQILQQKQRVRKIQWAGHVVRMADNRTVRQAFLGKADGRKAGRQKLYCIEKDPKWMVVKRWRKKQKTYSYVMSFWRRHWLNTKDRMTTKNIYIYIYILVSVWKRSSEHKYLCLKSGSTVNT